jgi:hypothetical protein
VAKRKKPSTPVAALPRARDVWLDRGVIALAALIVFGRALPYPLLPSWDDGRFLIDDPLVTQPTLAAFVSIWSEPHFEAYHPLHLLSYWIDVPWFGPVGWAVRTTSLVLFVGVGLAMLTWMRALGVGRFASLLATLAFVVHPVQVELVVWGSGRKDLLAELFGLLAWLAHLRSKSDGDRDAWTSRALFACACLSKTSAVTLPLAMFATDVWLARAMPRDAARRQAPAAIIAVVLSGVTVAIWHGHEMIREVSGASGSASLVLASLSHAISTLVFPARVSPLYAFVEDTAVTAPLLFGGAFTIAALLAIATRQRATPFGRVLGAGTTSFLALYAPVANVVPMYYEFQDRHLSFPLVGLVLALAALLDRARAGADERAPSLGAIVLGLACVVPLGARTMQYASVWSSDLRLWAHATSTHPRAYYAWLKLGEVRRDAGHFDGAIEAYNRAIEIRPNQRLGYGALLMTLARRDERDEAIAPSHADDLLRDYLRDVDDAEALSRDARAAMDLRYRWAALMFLSRQLDLAPVSDERLEHAAEVQLALNHEWLARFYVGRMSRRPITPMMNRFWLEERRRLGLPPLQEGEEDPRPDAIHVAP